MRNEKLRLRDGDIQLTLSDTSYYTGELFIGTSTDPVVQTLSVAFLSDQ
jgi:hypothetical protein